MKQRFVYIVSTEANSSTDGCIEHVWSHSMYYAKMYAKAFMAQQSKRYQYEADISQYDTLDKDDMYIISTRCSEKDMLKITTNLIGEQFLLTETAENNAYNIGALKMVSNKYLDAFSQYFNKNGAGALFVTVHVVSMFNHIIKNKSFVGLIDRLFTWLLDNADEGVKMDYFTYYTIENKRIRNFKIGKDTDSD